MTRLRIELDVVIESDPYTPPDRMAVDVLEAELPERFDVFGIAHRVFEKTEDDLEVSHRVFQRDHDQLKLKHVILTKYREEDVLTVAHRIFEKTEDSEKVRHRIFEKTEDELDIEHKVDGVGLNPAERGS